MRTGIFFILLIWLIGGCSDSGQLPITEERPGDISLAVASPVGVDTALIFFFRKYDPNTDTLVYRNIIYGVSGSSGTFRYKLPAGYYNVVIIGNVDANHIGSFGEFTSSDMLVEYVEGEEPPVIYQGSGYVNIGQDRVVDFTLSPVTSRVVLRIEEKPVNVARIDVSLYNTGSGIFLDGTYFDELVTPAISRKIIDMNTDEVVFSCFPSVISLARSFIGVKCYDASGILIFSGQSSAFTAKPGIVTTLKGWFGKSLSFDVSVDTGWK